MTKLTDTQATLLAYAAAREDGSVLPPPETLKARGGALDRILRSLLKRGLVQEVRGADPEATWREADDGAAIGLHITTVGLDTIGIEPSGVVSEVPLKSEDGAKQEVVACGDSAPGSAADGPSRQSGPKTGARPKGKLGLVLAAVERRAGATLGELVDRTGWQPHTTRAALTQLRKRGFPVTLGTTDGRKAYRIAAEAS
ncbi:MAG: DUF3489 domain-containing protein [Pseudomonadota bacterium]